MRRNNNILVRRTGRPIGYSEIDNKQNALLFYFTDYEAIATLIYTPNTNITSSLFADAILENIADNHPLKNIYIEKIKQTELPENEGENLDLSHVADSNNFVSAIAVPTCGNTTVNINISNPFIFQTNKFHFGDEVTGTDTIKKTAEKVKANNILTDYNNYEALVQCITNEWGKILKTGYSKQEITDVYANNDKTKPSPGASESVILILCKKKDSSEYRLFELPVQSSGSSAVYKKNNDEIEITGNTKPPLLLYNAGPIVTKDKEFRLDTFIKACKTLSNVKLTERTSENIIKDTNGVYPSGEAKSIYTQISGRSYYSIKDDLKTIFTTLYSNDTTRINAALPVDFLAGKGVLLAKGTNTDNEEKVVKLINGVCERDWAPPYLIDSYLETIKVTLDGVVYEMPMLDWTKQVDKDRLWKDKLFFKYRPVEETARKIYEIASDMASLIGTSIEKPTTSDVDYTHMFHLSDEGSVDDFVFRYDTGYKYIINKKDIVSNFKNLNPLIEGLDKIGDAAKLTTRFEPSPIVSYPPSYYTIKIPQKCYLSLYGSTGSKVVKNAAYNYPNKDDIDNDKTIYSLLNSIGVNPDKSTISKESIEKINKLIDKEKASPNERKAVKVSELKSVYDDRNLFDNTFNFNKMGRSISNVEDLIIKGFGDYTFEDKNFSDLERFLAFSTLYSEKYPDLLTPLKMMFKGDYVPAGYEESITEVLKTLTGIITKASVEIENNIDSIKSSFDKMLYQAFQYTHLGQLPIEGIIDDPAKSKDLVEYVKKYQNWSTDKADLIDLLENALINNESKRTLRSGHEARASFARTLKTMINVFSNQMNNYADVIIKSSKTSDVATWGKLLDMLELIQTVRKYNKVNEYPSILKRVEENSNILNNEADLWVCMSYMADTMTKIKLQTLEDNPGPLYVDYMNYTWFSLIETCFNLITTLIIRWAELKFIESRKDCWLTNRARPVFMDNMFSYTYKNGLTIKPLYPVLPSDGIRFSPAQEIPDTLEMAAIFPQNEAPFYHCSYIFDPMSMKNIKPVILTSSNNLSDELGEVCKTMKKMYETDKALDSNSYALPSVAYENITGKKHMFSIENKNMFNIAPVYKMKDYKIVITAIKTVLSDNTEWIHTNEHSEGNLIEAFVPASFNGTNFEAEYNGIRHKLHITYEIQKKVDDSYVTASNSDLSDINELYLSIKKLDSNSYEYKIPIEKKATGTIEWNLKYKTKDSGDEKCVYSSKTTYTDIIISPLSIFNLRINYTPFTDNNIDIDPFVSDDIIKYIPYDINPTGSFKFESASTTTSLVPDNSNRDEMLLYSKALILAEMTTDFKLTDMLSIGRVDSNWTGYTDGPYLEWKYSYLRSRTIRDTIVQWLSEHSSSSFYDNIDNTSVSLVITQIPDKIKGIWLSYYTCSKYRWADTAYSKFKSESRKATEKDRTGYFIVFRNDIPTVSYIDDDLSFPERDRNEDNLISSKYTKGDTTLTIANRKAFYFFSRNGATNDNLYNDLTDYQIDVPEVEITSDERQNWYLNIPFYTSKVLTTIARDPDNMLSNPVNSEAVNYLAPKETLNASLLVAKGMSSEDIINKFKELIGSYIYTDPKRSFPLDNFLIYCKAKAEGKLQDQVWISNNLVVNYNDVKDINSILYPGETLEESIKFLNPVEEADIKTVLEG